MLCISILRGDNMTGYELRAFINETGSEFLTVIVYDEHGELKCADKVAIRCITDGKGEDHVVIGIT